jgi:hypothetical protein
MGWLDPIFEIINKFIPDKAAQQKAAAEVAEYAQQAQIAQINTNTAEAQNKSVWVSGWRPCIGWQCALYIFWTKFLNMAFIYFELDYLIVPYDAQMMQLTFALLGVAWVSRTYEKSKGVS